LLEVKSGDIAGHAVPGLMSSSFLLENIKCGKFAK
jgi:hypothetical protein